MIKKTYVEFKHDSNEGKRYTTQEVLERDTSKLSVPPTVESFKFFDRVFGEYQDETEKVGLESKRLNESPVYYYGGEVIQQDQVSHGDILKEMMEKTTGRKVTHIIRKRFGGYKPFFPEEDIHLYPNNNPQKKPYFDEHSKLGR